MKSITMRIFINVSSIIILMLSFSSITSAQTNQQRPSQRSFATVLAKIKEKKSGRDRAQERMKQDEEKVEGTLVPPHAYKQDQQPGTVPPSGKEETGQAMPMQLPSRHPMLLPAKPKTNPG